MKSLLSLIVLIALTGCASQKDRKAIKEMANQSEVSDHKGLGKSIDTLIHDSKTLTEAQKKELKAIIAENKRLAESLMEQSYKYRSLLVSKLLSGNFKKKEINIIKKDIRKIENQRLKNTFETVEKISNIVVTQPEKDKFRDSLIKIDATSRY